MHGREAGEEVGFAAHVRGALHVVLPAERVHSATRPADVAGEQRQIRDAHDRVRALRVLGDAEAVEDHRRTARRIEPRGDADIACVDTATAGDAFGEVLGDEVRVLVEAGDAARQELAIDKCLVDDRGRDRVQQQDIRAGLGAQMHVGALGELDTARIDDDQRGASPQRLFDPGTDDGVVLGGVRPAHHDRVGVLDVGERARRRSRAERESQPGSTRRVTDARATVDIVRAEHEPGELLKHVIVLVRRARGTEDTDRGGSRSFERVAKAVGDLRDRLAPRRRAPAVVVTHERRHHTVGRMYESVPVSPLDARVAEVHRCVRRRDRGHDVLVTRADHELATHAAIWACRTRPTGRPTKVDDRPVLERAGRTRIDARAARHTRAFDERVRAAGHDACIRSASGDLPGELSLHLVADSNAPEAIDATVHVDRDARMCVVAPSWLTVVTGCPDAVAREQPVERLIRRADHRGRRVVTRRHLENAATRRFDVGGSRLDRHARDHTDRARGDRLCAAIDPNQAHTAFAVGLESCVVAQRR